MIVLMSASRLMGNPLSLEVTAEMNVHTMTLELFGRQITVSGMSHPGLWNQHEQKPLKSLGVTHLLSLEKRYQDRMKTQLSGVEHRLVDVPDFQAPRFDQLHGILKWLHTATQLSSSVHLGVHCWGGNGRTGTILSFLKIISDLQRSSAHLQSSAQNAADVVRDAVNVVRGLNPHAVEDVSQVELLEKVFLNQSEFLEKHDSKMHAHLSLSQEKALFHYGAMAALKNNAIREMRQNNDVFEVPFDHAKYQKAYEKALKLCGYRSVDVAAAAGIAFLKQNSIEAKDADAMALSSSALRASILEAVYNDKVALESAIAQQNFFQKMKNFWLR